LAIHPDGHMLALGNSEGSVTILQISTNEEVANFKTNLGKVNKIDFSENGYHMLLTGKSNLVEVWDLRNSEEVSKEVSVGGKVREACFDNSGRYMLVADENLHFFDTKKFNNFCNIDVGVDKMSVLKFGKFSSRIVCADEEGGLKILG